MSAERLSRQKNNLGNKFKNIILFFKMTQQMINQSLIDAFLSK